MGLSRGFTPARLLWTWGLVWECVADRPCYRTFLTRAYPTMKKNNPHVPIMIREGTGVLPRIYARYGELELRP